MINLCQLKLCRQFIPSIYAFFDLEHVSSCYEFSISLNIMVDVALLQTMATRQLSFWLGLGWLMCSLSLIRGLGRCGTEAWMSDVFSLTD